jgi:uncharacterized protein (DUF3084 family)
MIDYRTSILHLYLAIVGGMVIAGAGLASFLWFDRLPLLSFLVGPLISATALASLQTFRRTARKS